MPGMISAPDGYGDRVRLCLEKLPGKDADKARLLAVATYQVCRWKSGQNTPLHPEPLANACGIPASLLVYGPTERLRVVLLGQWAV